MSRPGRHFLQIPGPTNVPDRVLRAMGNPSVSINSTVLYTKYEFNAIDRFFLAYWRLGLYTIFKIMKRGVCHVTA